MEECNVKQNIKDYPDCLPVRIDVDLTQLRLDLLIISVSNKKAFLTKCYMLETNYIYLLETMEKLHYNSVGFLRTLNINRYEYCLLHKFRYWNKFPFVTNWVHPSPSGGYIRW